MGSHQLEGLPARRPWKHVVGLLGEGAGMAGLPDVAPGSLEAVADATMDASVTGLSRAKGDDGLAYAFYLLTQVTQAARQKDFARALDRADHLYCLKYLEPGKTPLGVLSEFALRFPTGPERAGIRTPGVEGGKGRQAGLWRGTKRIRDTARRDGDEFRRCFTRLVLGRAGD